jgi:hypothetical protein
LVRRREFQVRIHHPRTAAVVFSAQRPHLGSRARKVLPGSRSALLKSVISRA